MQDQVQEEIKKFYPHLEKFVNTLSGYGCFNHSDQTLQIFIGGVTVYFSVNEIRDALERAKSFERIKEAFRGEESTC